MLNITTEDTSTKKIDEVLRYLELAVQALMSKEDPDHVISKMEVRKVYWYYMYSRDCHDTTNIEHRSKKLLSQKVLTNKCI